eukprot:644597-Pelagomonas_calceolata.AAC.2
MGLALMTRVLHRTALWRPNQAAKARSAEEEVVRKKGWVWQERRLWRERRLRHTGSSGPLRALKRRGGVEQEAGAEREAGVEREKVYKMRPVGKGRRDKEKEAGAMVSYQRLQRNTYACVHARMMLLVIEHVRHKKASCYTPKLCLCRVNSVMCF